jgi:DNA-binding NarL/FixJ family response regulator
VVLLSTQPLLGEALANLLRNVKDVELIGPWNPDEETLARLPNETPDILLLATDDGELSQETTLTARILARYPDLPLMQVSIEDSEVRLYTTKTMLASSSDLIEAIRSLPHRP